MKKFLSSLIIIFASFTLYAQSDSARFYFGKGKEEQNARKFAMAAKSYDKAIQFDPNYIDAYIENGKVSLEMRRIDPAQGYFTKAITLQPDNPVAIKELASLYFNNRQFQKAIDLALKCKACPESNRIIAMSYFNLEDYGKAIPGLQRELQRNPKDAEATYTLGRSFVEQQDYKNSIVYYQKAIILDSSRGSWMYELGLLYYNATDDNNAMKYFLMAGNNGYPQSNDFKENLGFVYLNTGDIENGMKTLEGVLSKRPNDKDLLGGVAQAMYKAKKYQEALTYYQKLLELNPQDASSLYMAGITFQRMNQKEKGQAMCDQAIKLDPSLAKNRQKKGESMGL